MIISFQLGIDSPNSCFMLRIVFFPTLVNTMSFVLIATDKVIAIIFPFKHRRIMISRVVATIISGTWLLATASSIIFNVDGIINVPVFGACNFKGAAFTDYLLAIIIPGTANSILAIILNFYLAIVAYQVNNQIEKETRLSGGSSGGSSSDSQSERVTVLKRKQHNMRQNMKPVIILLVVTFGNVFSILVFPVLYILGKKLFGFLPGACGIYNNPKHPIFD